MNRPPRPARSHPAAFPAQPLAAVTGAPCRRPERNAQELAAGPPPRRDRVATTDCRVPPRPRPRTTVAPRPSSAGGLRQRCQDLLDQRAAAGGRLVRHESYRPPSPIPAQPAGPADAYTPVDPPRVRQSIFASCNYRLVQPSRDRQGRHQAYTILRIRQLLHYATIMRAAVRNRRQFQGWRSWFGRYPLGP